MPPTDSKLTALLASNDAAVLARLLASLSPPSPITKVVSPYARVVLPPRPPLGRATRDPIRVEFLKETHPKDTREQRHGLAELPRTDNAEQHPRVTASTP